MYVAFVVSSLVFVLFPQIDIMVSGLFFDKDFFASQSLWADFFYYSVQPLIFIFIISGIILWLYNRFKKRDLFYFHGRHLLYTVLVLAIGSGLIVNAILKDHWGRARPNQTIEFGGDKTFSPAFYLSDQDGYSFSCGHGSAAFSLIAVALLMRKRKNLWMGLAIGYGSLVSLARIAAGGHFLSDVVVSFFIMYFTAKILYALMIEEVESS
jgi:lipid A 4'-phosphatase